MRNRTLLSESLEVFNNGDQWARNVTFLFSVTTGYGREGRTDITRIPYQKRNLFKLCCFSSSQFAKNAKNRSRRSVVVCCRMMLSYVCLAKEKNNSIFRELHIKSSERWLPTILRHILKIFNHSTKRDGSKCWLIKLLNR